MDADTKHTGAGIGGGKAAIGASGGILVLLLKLCSAESHAVGGAATAARGASALGHEASGVGALARGAGEVRGAARAGDSLGGAGRTAAELGATARGAEGAVAFAEHGGARLLLGGASADVDVAKLTPLVRGSHAGEEGARRVGRAAARGASPLPGAAKAAPPAKLSTILEHVNDAKDLFDLVSTVWDFVEPLDAEDERALATKFESMGVDFDELVAAARGARLPDIAGSAREILSDGHALVIGARVPENAPLTLLDDPVRRSLGSPSRAGSEIATVYLEVPTVYRVASVSADRRLEAASVAPEVRWSQLALSGDATRWPTILSRGAKRFLRISEGGKRVVLVETSAEDARR